MARATDSQQNVNLQATTETAVSENHDNGTKYVPIPEEKFKARLKYALEKYDEIWKSLSDK